MQKRIIGLATAFLPWTAMAQSVSRSPVHASVDPIVAEVGAVTEASVELSTEGSFRLFGFRLQTSPALLRVASWSLGEGLLEHIEENGEPPVCDVIVYPDGTGMLAIMALAAPYSSEVYGAEWMRVQFEVAAGGPRASCLFMQSDTEDYEEDSVSRLSRLLSSAKRECVPLAIVARPRFLRGDVNATADRDITDAIRLLSSLFVDAEPLVCADAADVTDDGTIDVSDPVAILAALFLSTAPLPRECERDTTTDTLPPCRDTRCSGSTGV